jgi:MinD superfamily P-loop ATPase
LKLAIASGKGGTGKTLVAVNLALSLEDVRILDCDVEEPNVHIFLKPEQEEIHSVELLVPRILEDECDYCGECSRFCQYNALFVAGETIMVFPELCHSCGGCRIICPKNAIIEEPRKIGRIVKGHRGETEIVYGEMNVGEPLAVPVISAVKKHMKPEGMTILDAPPGTACSLVETVLDTDFVILVTEPTPFGLHDLQIAVEVVMNLKIPLGVIVNFAGIGDRGVYEFCDRNQIPILLEIPFDRKIAELYSNGTPFTQEMPEWKKKFEDLIKAIGEDLGN